MTVSTRLPPPSGACLRLITLGDAALYVSSPGAASERALDVGKPLALLIYLACSRDRAASREHLTDLLWAHMERDRAQNALRQTIWQIRTRLGDDVLTATRDRVLLNAAIEVDRDAFLAASAAGDVDRVVDLYRSDFVMGFAAPGGAEFEQWADLERRALRGLFVRSVEEVVQQRLASGHAREALALARRARDLDPLNQRAWRQVLECLIAAGDTVGAHMERDKLTQLLNAEEIEPEPATRAVMRGVRTTPDEIPGRKTSDAAHGLVAELIGREKEFATIMRGWDDAARGQTKLFHIVAPAGYGKTRLLVDVQNRLRATGARVVYIRADFGARDIPYAFASDIAVPLAKLRGARGISPQSAGTLVALNPSLSSVFSADRDTATDDEALRRRALALRDLLTTLADEHPVAILLDDLHWSDTLSFRALETAIGAIERSSLLIVSAGRPTPDEARRPRRATPIALASLSEDSVAALMSSLANLPLASEPWAARIPRALCDATGGSPLLVLETLQLLMEQSLLMRSSDDWVATDAAAVFRVLGQGSALRRRVESLSPTEGRILLLLAVSGLSLVHEVLADAAACSADDLAAAIAVLEQRGLVVCRGRMLLVAHDEHAAAAIEAASSDAIQSAAGAVGRALLARADNDGQMLCAAASLLARGGDSQFTALSAAFERFVRLKRLARDRRADRLLARELLGSLATDSLERSLIRSLPWVVRARLVSGGRVAAAIAIAGIFLFTTVVAWAALSRPVQRPDAVFVARRMSADRATFEYFPVSLDASRWSGITTVDVPVSGRPRWRLKSFLGNGGYDVRPDGRGWTGGVVVPDSGAIDVFEFGVDGAERRLTFAKSDDYESSWAPDNSRFVFVTARWSQRGHYDLAIYDTLSRDVRHLTQGDDTDWEPAWSPDGSRIAFIRQYAGEGQRGLCVIDSDGDHLRCLPPETGVYVALARWTDAHRVLVRRTKGGTTRLARVSVETGATDLVDDGAGSADISPDGQFALCSCPRQGYTSGTMVVYPIERPNEFAVIREVGGDARPIDFQWAPTTPHLPFISRMNILFTLGAPVLGASYQLRATGVDVTERTVDPGVVRWRSEDTSIAVVDSTGLLTARRAGRVTIDASAGGWRNTRTTLTIAAPVARVLLDEDWTHGLAPAWRPFGDPIPLIVSSTALPHAFLNNGDGSFFSGAYTTRGFDTRGGLWVDAELSTPITAPESQELVLSLRSMADSVVWATWDHRTGDGPIGVLAPSWGLRYPAGIGGAHFGEQFMVAAPTESYLLSAPPSLRTGQPYHLVMQIFPDGRCGVAIGGRPVWVGHAAFFEPTVHVVLSGNSVDTKILIGHLQVSTGLAPGIAWDAKR